MASASWSTETDEKINYTKLCRLLVDGGTQAVRSVFDGIHPPSSLKVPLNANKATLQKLKKPKGKVLNNEQWYQLYPPSGSDPKSEDFDITLLFVLLRNICGLTAPATGWDALPPVTDTSKEANLARIKYYRNTIAHITSTEISDADFKQHWQNISSALRSMGLSQDDIDDLKSAPLGKKDYNQLLNEWYISDQDIKTQLEDVKSVTADIKSDTAGIKSDTTDIKSDTADLKSDTADLKSDTVDIKSDIADVRAKLDDMEAHKMDDQIQKLASSNFRPEINTKCKSFHSNTRQWILDEVKSHVDHYQPRSCVMLITAGPGMGKSTLAAKICQTYKDLGCLAGCHFFQFSNSTRNNPRLMLQSIAKQMCEPVPGYREALGRKLQTNLGKEIAQMNCEELLTVLFEEPLCNVAQPNSNLVVVIDALDECSLEPKDDFLKALSSKLPRFPSWLRFVFTSRPSRNTSGALWPTAGVEIKPNDQANIKDLELFFSFELKARYPQCDDDYVSLGKKLVKMTKGLFLVASFMMEYLKRENVASPKKILELFPNGISSVYENYFSRLKEVLLPYISEEERFYKMLEAIVATNNPLPKDMFYNILCLKSEREVPRQERRGRRDALNTLHWLFPFEGEHVTAFHKSVIDWLTLQDDEGHDFSVRVKDGDEVLASQCNEVLSVIRNGRKDLDKPLNITDSEEYALRFLADHLEEGSSVVKADTYEFLSNIYILTALLMKTTFLQKNAEGTISSSLLEILRTVQSWSFITTLHDTSCRLFRPLPFGCYLAWVLQAAHRKGVHERKPFDVLKKHFFPYFDKKSFSMNSEVSVPFFQRCIHKCKDGFIAGLLVSLNPPSTVVYRFQLDGCLIKQKCFPSETRVATSPTINFIVAFESDAKIIEILDATTLEVVSQHESPKYCSIKTCHVFGNDQAFFIAIMRWFDENVYIIEGLTGRVRNTITATDDSVVMDVSCLGHIVVSRTWKDENPKGGNECTNHRGIFLYDHDSEHEPIPVHPLAKIMCPCGSLEKGRDEAVRVSEDGCLLACHYNDSIFMVYTSDGRLFKCLPWPLQKRSRSLDFLFVSRSYLVFSGAHIMYVMNVQTDEIEHRIGLPYNVGLKYQHHYLLLPEEDGKSFNLISSHRDRLSHSSEVSRLVFHNLNLQGRL